MVTTENGPPPQGALSSGRIIVAEDDLAVQKVLRRLFLLEGYAVDIAPNGTVALELFRKSPPDAFVLDLRLPGKPGQQVCREIKEANPAQPVVILSAKSDVSDKVLLLELGADDYVTKPFSPRELLARVRAAIRRVYRAAPGDSFSFSDIVVEFPKMQVTRNGEPIQLTPQEFKALKFLVQNPERVIPRTELLNEVWGYNNYPSTRTVDNHILRLRQKLEHDPGNPVHFRTVHSAGYKFIP